ncbi:MFS transporter [Microbacterium sp. NPDC058342]|uniref:MFS transporter n=1 Tax=Microbacterium sp. NPDC058342 TaxID=3346454 RepID=UPI0036644276
MASETPSARRAGERVGPIALLILTSALLLMDTSLISLLIEPIRQDLGFSDGELGLLQGAVPTLAYALCAIPVGLLVDRFDRGRMILIALVLWTGALVLIVTAPGYAMLVVAKAIIGAVQAVLVTAPFSLIADLSSRRRRSGAISALVVGQYIGAALGFALGGVVFAAMDGLADVAPWRLTVLAFGVAGVLLIPFYLGFREPARTERETGFSAAGALLGGLGRQTRTLWPLFAAYAFAMIAGSVLQVWTAPAFIRLYGLSEAEVGGIAGAVTLVGGVAGAVLAGWLAERARRRRRRGTPATVIAALLLGVSTSLAIMPSTAAAVTLFTVGMIAAGVIGTSVTAFLMLYLPNQMRGLAGGALILLGIGPGLSLGPSLVAAVSERTGGDLGGAMAWVGVLAAVCSAALFLVLGRLTRRLPVPEDVPDGASAANGADAKMVA